MADITNLESFLGDIAQAIKNKKGTTDPIPAANFDTEIESIPTGEVVEKIVAEASAIIEDETVVKIETTPVPEPVVLPENAKAEVLADKIVLAESVGLTPDKIVQGACILGIEGTAEGGSGEGIKQFATIEEMNADTEAKEGDLALVYNTSSDGLYEYQTLENQIVIPYEGSITYNGGALYTPNKNDEYIPYDKLVNVITKMITERNMKQVSFLGSTSSLSNVTVTILSGKVYAVLAAGKYKTSSAETYKPVYNEYDSASAQMFCLSSVVGSNTNMTNDAKLALFELDLENEIHRDPVYLTGTNVSGAIYRYDLKESYVANYSCINIKASDCSVSSTTNVYAYNTSTSTSASVKFTPSDVTKWVLQPNTKYLDTSDATATKYELNKGSTAYVNGEKIEGVSTLFNINKDIKRYDTLEELNAIYDEPIGTKGAVYGLNKCDFTYGQIIHAIYLPKTIVLSEPLTSEKWFNVEAYIEYQNGEKHKDWTFITCGVDSTDVVEFIEVSVYYGNHLYLDIRYTSTDGITFIREADTASGGSYKLENDMLTWGSDINIIITDINGPASGGNDYMKFLNEAFKIYTYKVGGIYEMSTAADYNTNKHCSKFTEVINNNASRQLYKCYLGAELNKVAVGIGHIGNYHDIKDAVIIDEAYTGLSGNTHGILHDTVKNKYYYGKQDAFHSSDDINEIRTNQYTKIANGVETTHTIEFTIANAEYKADWGNGTTGVFIPIFEITDIDNAYIMQSANNSNMYLYDETMAQSETYVSPVANNSLSPEQRDYLMVQKYTPMPTQMTLESNSHLLPGFTVLGKDGKTYEGDGTIYDYMKEEEQEQVIKFLYNNDYMTSTEDTSAIKNFYNNQLVVKYPDHPVSFINLDNTFKEDDNLGVYINKIHDKSNYKIASFDGKYLYKVDSSNHLFCILNTETDKETTIEYHGLDSQDIKILPNNQVVMISDDAENKVMIYKINLDTEEIITVNIPIDGTVTNTFANIPYYDITNNELHFGLEILLDNPAGCMFKLIKLNISTMTYTEIYTKTLQRDTSAGYSWDMDMAYTNTGKIIAYCDLLGSTIDPENHVVCLVEYDLDTLTVNTLLDSYVLTSSIVLSTTYPYCNTVVIDDGEFIYSGAKKINKATLETSSISILANPSVSSYDNSFSLSAVYFDSLREVDKISMFEGLDTSTRKYLYCSDTIHYLGNYTYVPEGELVWGTMKFLPFIEDGKRKIANSITRPFVGELYSVKYTTPDKAQFMISCIGATNGFYCGQFFLAKLGMGGEIVSGPISQEEYDVALDTANEILGEEVSE